MSAIAIFLFVLCTSIGTCSASCAQIPLNPAHTGKTLKGHVLEKLKVQSISRCVHRCEKNMNCLSFNFDSDTKECEINSKDSLIATGDLVATSRNVIFSDIKDWLGAINTQCKGIQCLAGERCDGDTAVCIKPGTSQCWSTDYSYTGSMSVTKGGIQCQRWDSQYPHSHIFDEDELYPFDGTTTAAENYCRDPDSSSIPWCFTVDIGKRWENCDIPLCDDKEYLLVFRGFSGISNGPFDNMVDIYNAWESGVDTSDLICSTNCSAHYRLFDLEYWDHFGHSKVKVSLHANGVEKQFLIFNGTESTLTNWFSSGRLLNSSWKNLASQTYHDFSLNGDGYSNRFVINIDDTSCDNRRGFLTILINDTCAFNRSIKYPKILYSDSIDQPAFWNIDEVEGILHQADYLDISTTIN